VATHQSLQRAIAVLREFSEQEPALSVTEMSARLGLHKSTVSRLLGVLRDEGLVWHNPETGRYSLGLGLVELAGVALGQVDVRAAAMPHMEGVGAATGETVAVSVQRGHQVLTVAVLPATQPIRHVSWIGRRVPLHSTAAGRVFLASTFASGGDWRSLVALAEADHADAELLLDGIAQRGFAEEVDDFEEGTAAVAAPILDESGAAVAALSVSGPSDRLGPDTRAEIGRRLVDAAASISVDLGFVRHVLLEQTPA